VEEAVSPFPAGRSWSVSPVSRGRPRRRSRRAGVTRRSLICATRPGAAGRRLAHFGDDHQSLVPAISSSTPNAASSRYEAGNAEQDLLEVARIELTSTHGDALAPAADQNTSRPRRYARSPVRIHPRSNTRGSLRPGGGSAIRDWRVERELATWPSGSPRPALRAPRPGSPEPAVDAHDRHGPDSSPLVTGRAMPLRWSSARSTTLVHVGAVRLAEGRAADVLAQPKLVLSASWRTPSGGKALVEARRLSRWMRSAAL